MERLQKVIANTGFTSRRKAEELIKNGKVKVNKVLEKTDRKYYFMLNKPRGYISSCEDEKNRKTIVDLIGIEARIYPVGRLDYDTTGLILLTNDGELTNILTHPKNEVPKTYIAKIEGNLTLEEFYRLKKGVVIENRKVTPEFIKIRKKSENSDIVEITIVEGRNHIVKKIFESVNHAVIKLKREKYGFLTLGNLESGEYRELSIKEVKKLYNYK